jgi:tetratricopeptide (TPR) repeat protein
MERPEGSNEMPPGMEPMPGSPAASSSKPKAESSKPAPAPKQPEPKEEPMEVDDEDAKAKKEAEAVKAQGNAAYKARKFEEAIEHYNKAWELYPKDVAFLTNLSGELDLARSEYRADDQLFTLNREITRNVSRHVRRLSKRVEIYEQTTRSLPSKLSPRHPQGQTDIQGIRSNRIRLPENG